MDLAGHCEDPSLVGMLLLPALAGRCHAVDIRQLAVAGAAHHQFPATILSRVGLVAKSFVRGSIARIGSHRELDQPEPRLVHPARRILQLRNLDVLESQIPDLERRSGSARPPLRLQFLALRFLIRASAQPCDVGRRGDATLHVRGVPEVADEHQPGKAIRHLPFRQAVRMRVEPVHPARMIGCDHVAVADVAVLQAHQGRSGIQRAGVSLPVRRRGMCMAGRATA